MNPSTSAPLVDIRDLTVTFTRGARPVNAVNGVDLRIERGEVVALIGESGSGKSVTLRSLMRLHPPQATRIGGHMMVDGTDVMALDRRALADYRGARVAMIFQEPLTALDPVYTLGDQIVEAIRRHESISSADARKRALELFERVRIPSPERRLAAYPHEMSGGMRQRVMIAMALACKPQLLIADEPTTALDVSVQAQILDLMLQMQHDHGTAMMFISHNFGVISEMADEVMVMYAGTTVEQGLASQVLQQPRHPYTRGLLSTVPDLDRRVDRLPIIAGSVPDLSRLPQGCSFQSRCDQADAACRQRTPALATLDESAAVGPAGRPMAHQVACIHA